MSVSTLVPAMSAKVLAVSHTGCATCLPYWSRSSMRTVSGVSTDYSMLVDGMGEVMVRRLIDGLRGCHPQADAHTLCVCVAPMCVYTPIGVYV